MGTIFDIHHPGHGGTPSPVFPGGKTCLPPSMMRESTGMPQVSEVECVRHYTRLSTMNFGVDTGFYPLGSCTMKYNPKINERTSALPGFAGLHPMAHTNDSQGALELVYELQKLLTAVTGMHSFSLMPAAGAHGELTAVMIMKKYFKDRDENRRKVIIPDSAHGTNPASVAMCGYDVITVPSNSQGDVDIDELEKILDNDVAGMMLTSPSTLGLFDRNITTIASMLHENGSLFYGDGANFNAVMGKVLMSDMGFDMIHLNLHKSFSTPHGGGGPGSGPVGVTATLSDYLPVPRVKKKDGQYLLDENSEATIGRIHSFMGNFLIFVRAYTYLLTLGSSVGKVGETAVLNANYLMSHLRTIFHLPIDRTCMHEFVISDQGLPDHVTTNDIAKRILDYGFHAPTVYFPLIVNGAMMIEPTETESKESLDSFIQAMKNIHQEIHSDPELVKSAPHSTPVKRVDAVTAARKPVLSWDDNA